MRAHVIRRNIVEDRAMLGEAVARLFLEQGVEVLVFESLGGMVAGYGPFEVELEPDPRLGDHERFFTHTTEGET